MSTIENIEKISDVLGNTTIFVQPRRCIYIRNLHSHCKACVVACPHDAIVHTPGHLEIDFEECSNCGACVVACPAGVFATTAPTAGALVSKAQKTASLCSQHAIFACSMLDQEKNIDHSRVCILPCLDYLDEYLIVGFASCDIKSVNLIEGNCKNCPISQGMARYKKTLQRAWRLLETWSIELTVRLLEAVPQQLYEAKNKAHTADATGRRQAIRQSAQTGVDFIVQGIYNTINTFDTAARKKKPKNSGVVVKLEERYKAESYRSVRLLKMLQHLGAAGKNESIKSRFWAKVQIDPTLCKHCGMCAKMCPTRALIYTKTSSDEDKQQRGTLSFKPSLCINCHLCKDSCLNHAFIYDNTLLCADLASNYEDLLFEDEAIRYDNPFGRGKTS